MVQLYRLIPYLNINFSNCLPTNLWGQNIIYVSGMD